MCYFKNTTVWGGALVTLLFLKVGGQNFVSMGYFDVLSSKMALIFKIQGFYDVIMTS